jgi:short-subunit dehydrogenase
VADLSKIADVDRAVREATNGRHLSAAVLNAGITHFGHNSDLEWERFQRMLDTNVTGVVRMTNALLEHLEARHGALMLVSSMTGLSPWPYQSAYSGTKGFLVNFGLGLRREIAGRSLSLTVYAPAGIATEMTAGDDFAPLRNWLMPVDRVARTGIDAMRRRRHLTIPGFTNRIGDVLMRLLPRRLVTAVVGRVYKNALDSQPRQRP